MRYGGQLSNTGRSTATLMVGHTSSDMSLGEGTLTVTGTGSITPPCDNGGLMVGSSSKVVLNVTDGGMVQNNAYAYLVRPS